MRNNKRQFLTFLTIDLNLVRDSHYNEMSILFGCGRIYHIPAKQNHPYLAYINRRKQILRRMFETQALAEQWLILMASDEAFDAAVADRMLRGPLGTVSGD